MMPLGLGLGLGLSSSANAGGAPGIPPTTISLSRTSVPEDLAVGVDVGLLTNDGTASVTYSIISDPENKFTINSNNDGVALEAALNFEADTSHPVTVRATYSGGTLDQAFTITVTDIVEDTHNPDLPADQGTLVFDGGFTIDPSKGNSGSNLKLQGKSGGTAKFVFDIGAAGAGRTYTVRYDPDFSLLSNTGREAFVGFGFKSGNDFHFTGLKGDGASGLNAYKIYGANKFNASSGFTTVDDGAAAFGTQAGPNWLQIAIAANGSTYTLRTSSDGQSWTDEFTASTPTPLTNSTDATTFGIAVFLENSDKGTFSIDISVWSASAPLWTPLDLGSALHAWTDFSLLTGSDNTAIGSDAIPDQSGNGFTAAPDNVGANPKLQTNELNGKNVLEFVGSTLCGVQYSNSFYSGKTAGEMFVVCKANADPAANVFSQIGGTASGDNFPWSDGNCYLGFCTSAQKNGGNPSLSFTSWRIVSIHSGSNDFRFYIDGASQFSTGTNNVEVSQSANRVGAIGANSYAGLVAEIIFTDAISNQATREKVEGYLAHKYGLTGNLDSGHPYKNSAPTV